jgi:hypothetical protein
MLTENDFDKLIIVMKGLRYTFIWSPRSRVRDVVMFPIVSQSCGKNTTRVPAIPIITCFEHGKNWFYDYCIGDFFTGPNNCAKKPKPCCLLLYD